MKRSGGPGTRPTPNALAAVEKLSLADAPRFIWRGLKIGAEGIPLLKEQFAAALSIKAGYDAGFLHYSYFLAEKAG
jgi:hypothetical protein